MFYAGEYPDPAAPTAYTVHPFGAKKERDRWVTMPDAHRFTMRASQVSRLRRMHPASLLPYIVTFVEEAV